jgi:L-amino acid N-acyltransferase
MDVIFRQAVKNDLPTIQKLYNHNVLTSNAVYDETEKSEEAMISWLELKQQQNMPVIIAESNGQFFGYGTFGQFRPWEGFRYCVEHSLYIVEEYKGQGFGKLLLKQLISVARQMKMRSMVAGIDSENKGSLHLHRLLGFEEIGTFRNAGFKNGKWLDLTMLQLQLEKEG